MAKTGSANSRWRTQEQRSSAPKVDFEPSLVPRGLGVVLALGSLLIATALSFYAAASEWAGWLLRPLPFRLELDGNLEAAVVFFWLELLALVVGIRLYDEATQAGRRKRRLARKFESTTNDLVAATERIWDERAAFAEQLDNSPLPSGSYGAPLAHLNACLREIRDDFLRKQLADYDLTDHTRLLADRVLRVLDDMIVESFVIGEKIEVLHLRLQEEYAAASHSETVGGKEAAPADADDGEAAKAVPVLTGEDTGMDELLTRLFESVRPDKTGLEGLARVIAESYGQLGLGQATARTKH